MDSNSPFKDLLFPHGPNVAQKPWYLEGTVLKGAIYNFQKVEAWVQVLSRVALNARKQKFG